VLGYKICVPSKGRGGKVLTAKIFPDAFIYVPESEFHEYKMYKNVVSVPNSIKGITATRNYILKSNNCNILFIDDDLQYGGWIDKQTEKYKVIRFKSSEDFYAEFRKLWHIVSELDYKIWGLFTVGNNLTQYSYQPFILHGVVLGSCMGVINDGSYYFDETFLVKEDYELSMRHIKERGGILRANYIFMQHEHQKMEGGCRDSNRIQKEKEAIKKLIKLYPGWIKEAKHRGSDFAIQLNY
jgi:hypothetical protein